MRSFKSNENLKYLGFTVDGEVFQFRSLPFGIATALLVFTKLMEIVAAHIRKQGPRLIQYFDDWLNHRRSREELLVDLQIAWRSIVHLGLNPNTEKSELIKSQDFVYIGTNFCTDLGIVKVPEDRVNNIICLLFKISRQAVITARKYLSLLGTLNSTADQVILGRFHMRPLQFYLKCDRQQSVFAEQDVTDRMEWPICSTVLSQINSKWGQPMSDLFATRFSKKLPLFVSPVPDGGCVASGMAQSVCLRVSTVQTDPPSTEQNQENCNVFPLAFVTG